MKKLNVFNELKKILCPDCKLIQCSNKCLDYQKLMRVQKLLHTIMMSDRNRIKKTLGHINFEKVLKEMKDNPKKHKQLLLSLIIAIIDGKVGV